MKHKAILWMILVLLATWGCAEKDNAIRKPDEQEGNKPDEYEKGDYSVIPPHELRFGLLDLATHVDESALQISMFLFTPPLDTSLLEAAVQEVIRLTDAHGSPIHLKTSIRQNARYGENRRIIIIQVTPDEPLKDGWHVLSLTTIPKGFAIPGFMEPLRSDDGTISVRFRTDSWPMLTGVIVASNENGGRMYLYFSEPIKLNEALKSLLTVTSPERDMACRPSIQILESYDTLGIICAPMSEQDKITIEIPPGLLSLEGIELKGPLVHQFIVGEIEEHVNGAWYYRASIVE